MPWHWVREQRSKEAFVNSKKAVRAGAGAYECEPRNAGCAVHIWPQDALWLTVDGEVGQRRSWQVQWDCKGWGCSESKQAALLASGSLPRTRLRKGGSAHIYFQDHGNTSKLLERNAKLTNPSHQSILKVSDEDNDN